MNEDFFMHLHTSNRIWKEKDSQEHSDQREKYDNVKEMPRAWGQEGRSAVWGPRNIGNNKGGVRGA